ncbi:calcium-binding protein [Streptomyces sp. NPDC005955]|uniref:calcium-binding protein n=1 Tax=Streptomyces sp. NPDC005955 TaxID=3364738 RepID=UPI0036CD67B8
MRKRVSAVVATGALALTGLAVPAAHAAPAAAEAIELTNIEVNGGKDVVIGTGNKKFTIKFDASHSSNIQADPSISAWRGADGILLPDGFLRDQCKSTSPTTSSCTATFNVNPQDYDIFNDEAGSWKTEVYITSKDYESVLDKDNIKSFKVLRASKLTANASPEPIKKGKTLTITGALTRANWDEAKYAGYTSQSVKLQFQKKGTTTWSTVKTIKSDSRGNLRTTVKAERDGSFRYVFAGTSTTPAVNSSADAVDVT